MTALMGSTPVESFLATAAASGRKTSKSGTGWLIACPGPRHAHDDRRPSLKVDEGEGGRVLLHCHAGCDPGNILDALGLTAADLFHPDSRRDRGTRTRPRTVAEHLGTAGLSRPPSPTAHTVTAKPSPVASPAVVDPTECTLDKCASIRRAIGQCVAQYEYRDAAGVIVGQVHRYTPKSFRPFTLDAGGQWKAGGKIAVPYRLPEVRQVLAAGGLVVVVEGERDADVIAGLGIDGVAATCNAAGAGKWTDAHSRALADGIGDGAVCIVGDLDAAGQDHVRKVRESLAAVGIDAAVQWPTRGKDIAEHLANGGTLADLADDIGGQVDGTDGTDAAGGPSSWEPLDLSAYIDGTHTPEVATLLPRSDGACLLYPGRLHSFHGESESGKSLVAQAEAARLLAEGERVLFLDFESDAATVVPRLIALGAPTAAIRDHLRYVRPHEPPTDAAGMRALDGLLSTRYALAVIDGLTDALGLLGASSLDLDEVSKFMRNFPRRVARSTGAATVVIDHVTKAQDTRGRFAVGSQAKMNALDGAGYVVEVVQPLGLGLRGVVSMRVAKDRPGTVRPVCGTYRKGDRTQEACRVIFDATGDDGRTVVEVDAPAARVGDESDAGQFRPTWYMKRVSEFLDGRREPASGRVILDHIGGKAEHVRRALALMIDEGYVRTAKGPKNAVLHALTRPYRQTLDPMSDGYAGQLDL